MPQKELYLQEIGNRIMNRRKKLGLTQEALAEKGEVTTQFVSYAEAGKRAMRPENLMKISDALGVSADYLLTGDVIDKAGGIDFSRPVLLGYSGISDALLLKYIEDSRHIWEGNLKEIRYTTVGSVIGTHAGPGAVVVAFFKK